MLSLERIRDGLQVIATCDQCGLQLLNPADGIIAFRNQNRLRERLLHQGCVKAHKNQHPKGWTFQKAAKVFSQLGAS